MKTKIKDNFKKNPKSTASLGVIGLAGVIATVCVLTGVIEPEQAQSLVVTLMSYLTLS